MPVNSILGNHLNYGVYHSNQLTPEQFAENGFIAYNPQMIARGIRVYWRAQEKQKITLHLSIPTSSEEIKELFDMVGRITAVWKSNTVKVGSQYIYPQLLDTVIEKYQAVNLKTLHEVGLTVLDGSRGLMIMGCAMHRLVIGKHEADYFWSGTDTDAFRDWMNERQSVNAILSEPEIYEPKDHIGAKVGEYSVYSGIPTIFPKHPAVPNKYYDFKTGRPMFEVSFYRVRLIDQETPVGYLTFQEFMRELPADSCDYYDADDYLIRSLTREELGQMVQRAKDKAKPHAAEE